MRAIYAPKKPRRDIGGLQSGLQSDIPLSEKYKVERRERDNEVQREIGRKESKETIDHLKASIMRCGEEVTHEREKLVLTVNELTSAKALIKNLTDELSIMDKDHSESQVNLKESMVQIEREKADAIRDVLNIESQYKMLNDDMIVLRTKIDAMEGEEISQSDYKYQVNKMRNDQEDAERQFTFDLAKCQSKADLKYAKLERETKQERANIKHGYRTRIQRGLKERKDQLESLQEIISRLKTRDQELCIAWKNMNMDRNDMDYQLALKTKEVEC